jgi:hypothetical protein
VRTDASPQPRSSRRWVPDLKVFLNGYPVPIFSYGMGALLEYRVLPHVSAVLAPDKDVSNKYDDEHVVTGTMSTQQADLLGGRLYLNSQADHGVFLAAGYKWSKIESDSQPSLFSKRATRIDHSSGAYVGLGYLFAFLRHARVGIFAGADVNYEPGEIKHLEYVADERSFLGATRAHLETKFGYGFFPKARFGVTF